jgi:hypothetical protein
VVVVRIVMKAVAAGTAAAAVAVVIAEGISTVHGWARTE